MDEKTMARIEARLDRHARLLRDVAALAQTLGNLAHDSGDAEWRKRLAPLLDSAKQAWLAFGDDRDLPELNPDPGVN